MKPCQVKVVDEHGNERYDVPTFVPLQGGRIIGMRDEGFTFVLIIELPR